MFKRKPVVSLLFLFLGITLLIGSGCAQDSGKSASPAVEISEKAVLNACAIAVDRIKAGDSHIANLEEETRAQAKALETLRAKAVLLEQTVALKEREAAALREAIALKDQAAVELTKALDLTKKEVEREKKRGKTKTRIAFVAGFVAGIALKFI